MHDSISSHDLIVLLGILAAVGGLLALEPVLRVPYPILLVLAGLGLALIPGVPTLELPPDIVLLALLPPLLYSSAFFTSLRDLRANLRPIGLLAIGLVVATTAIVAAVMHQVAGLPWASAVVLGAIVSPTDPVAANAIASRLGVPRRLIVIVEGESLVNDASALVIYRVGILAAIGGAFSAPDAGLRFVGAVTGGIAIGLITGYIVYRLRRPLNNPRAEIALSLMTAYFAYIPAELVGASAVIAAVTAGIYLGWHAPELMRPETRLQSLAVWEILVFLLNAFLFALVGLQLPVVLDGLQGESAATLLGYAAAICATVIVVRFVWVFPATYLPRLMSRRLRERDPYPPWQYPALISWIGMRGAVTLAAALAVPRLTDAGDPFPGRDLIIFLAFCVILFTLVVQGLSLPGVIRMLGLESDGDAAREESLARIRASEAAVDRLAELEAEEWVREDTAERIRGLYRFRASRFTARLDATDDGTIEQRSLAYQRLRHELLDAERNAVVDMRRAGEISDEVMNAVIRDLDLEDVRLDA